MKHILTPLLLLFILPITVKAQICSFDFTSGASPSSASSNATITDFTRTYVSAESYSGWFNSGSWNTTSTIDYTEYIEVTIEAHTGYQLNVSQVHFNATRTSQGPVNIRIAHNHSGNFTTDYKDTLPGTSSTAITWNFTDFTSQNGTIIKFRIYGWNAPSNGNLRIDDFVIQGAVTTSNTSGGGDSNTPFVFDTTKQFVGIATTGLPAYRLDINGSTWVHDRLFIGAVDSPQVGSVYKLAVNGEAIVTKLWVKKYTEWPDYVFDSTYNLKSLSEVELFVNANKHLPGVPSASEVIKSGLDIGNNQAALLQKIEEITLYLIEQSKEIKKQKEQIQELEKKINSKL